MKYILTFLSVYFVTKAEKILKQENFKVRMIPTPRKISSDCGMALEVSVENIDDVKKLLRKNKCAITGIYNNRDYSEL